MTDNFRILRMQVQRRLKEDLIKANRFFGKEFIAPAISYAVRGQKAGVAYLERNEVRFNPILLAENSQVFIQQTVPHELAHILVYQLFGKVAPHGKEWKMMMEDVFGVPANIYHSFDTRNTAKHFEYRCDCQIHLLSIRRHNALQRGQRQYICTKCRKPLRSTLS